MRKKLIVFFLFLFFFLSTGINKNIYAQMWEVGVFLGGSNYIGDLSYGPLGTMSETNGAAGAIIRYNFNGQFSLKGNAYYGTLSGSDENAPTEEQRHRNLHFRSRILDIGINAEYYITGYDKIFKRYTASPYLFAGLSVFRFNPQTEYEDEWVDLQPLGTEGQGTTQYQDREKYAITQFSIPFGIGLKHSIHKHWNLGFEVGFRTTFTDYIDDVSTTYVEEYVLKSQNHELSYILSNRTGVEIPAGTPRGDPTSNDWYYFFGITITYNIIPSECFRF